jgi:hypothetical protein
VGINCRDKHHEWQNIRAGLIDIFGGLHGRGILGKERRGNQKEKQEIKKILMRRDEIRRVIDEQCRINENDDRG